MRSRYLAGLALLCCTLPAYAGNWYVTGSVSESKVRLDRGALDTRLGTDGATGLSSTRSGSHAQWRLQGGYRFNPYLSIEGGYIDLGKARYNASYDSGSAEARWKSGGVDLAAVGRLPFDNGFALFGKAGVIDARTTTHWTSTGLTTPPPASTTDTRLVPFAGIGASYAIGSNWSVRAEYEHFAKVGAVRSTGRASIDTVSAGVVFNF